MRGDPQTPPSRSPAPHPSSAGDGAVAPPGDCSLEGAPEPAAPSWKKPEKVWIVWILAAAGPSTLARQGQEHPCPGRLPSGRGKTRPYICSDGNKTGHERVPCCFVRRPAETGCPVFASSTQERGVVRVGFREEVKGT